MEKNPAGVGPFDKVSKAEVEVKRYPDWKPMFLYCCLHVDAAVYIFTHGPVDDLKFTSASCMLILSLLYLYVCRPMCGCEYRIVTAVAQHIQTPCCSYKKGFPASKIFFFKKTQHPRWSTPLHTFRQQPSHPPSICLFVVDGKWTGKCGSWG